MNSKKLDRILSKNYTLRNNTITEIVDYINDMDELCKIMYILHDIIGHEFPNCELTIELEDDDVIDYTYIRVWISSDVSEEEMLEKEDNIYDSLYNLFSEEYVSDIMISRMY